MKRTMQFLICLLLILLSTCNNGKKPISSSGVVKNNAKTNAIKTNENISENAETNVIQTNEDVSEDEDFLDSWFKFYTFNIPSDEKEFNYYNINIEVCGLKFFKGKYIFSPYYEGDPPYIEGSYQIIDNKILLKYTGIPYYEDPKYHQHYKFDDILKEDWELEYTSISDSIDYTEGLIGKGIIFGREKSRPKAGDIIKTKEYDIVAVEKTVLNLQSNVTVRIGPGINYQHCIFELYDYVHKTTSITEYLKKDYEIWLLGHSINKDTIDGLTGYWYYCWIPVPPWMGGEIIEPKTKDNNGWIFEPSKFSEKIN